MLSCGLASWHSGSLVTELIPVCVSRDGRQYVCTQLLRYDAAQYVQTHTPRAGTPPRRGVRYEIYRSPCMGEWSVCKTVCPLICYLFTHTYTCDGPFCSSAPSPTSHFTSS